MRLVDLVKIDHRFEKSVNLMLDLNNSEKIKFYIPTRSSVKVLDSYIKEVIDFSGGRANILIGPYGKGKSHLLLVLMAILSYLDTNELHDLIGRISKMDAATGKLIKEVYGKHRFLPVIVNTNSGNLGQAFVRSLNQALKRSGLNDVIPDNYFSEATKMISQWKENFHSTYLGLEKRLRAESVEDFVRRLEQFDYEALDEFRKIYPSLTSGSEFNPVVDEEVLLVYRSVNRIICEKHGYSGIYIVFDEFSKYVEGHSEAGFSADMKVLQDICELCNSSKDEQLHLTCVAHKAIRAYGDALSKDVKNAFLGVEGRLKEVPFIVSSQNNYELIADAIHKKAKFSEWKAQSSEYEQMLEDSYYIPEFHALFEKRDFDSIVGEGCYPLTPLSALLLLNLSEKIAQNERTIFTFLAGKDLYSLANYVVKCRKVEYVGSWLIYDYFTQLFQEDKNSIIHNEWLKADFALSKAESEGEQSIIKSLAVIHMVNRKDDVPANDIFLRLASGMTEADYQKAMAKLLDKGIVVYKRGIAAYEFQSRIGVNIENIVSDCAVKYFSKFDTTDILNDVYRKKYILPKKYNKDYFMTRYYRVRFITAEAFKALPSVSYIKDNNRPDGFLLVPLMVDGNLLDHLHEISDPYAVLGLPGMVSDCKEEVRFLLAVRKLMNDKKFTEENELLVTELKIYENELIEELNQKMEMLVDSIKCLHTSWKEYEIGGYGLNRTISDICEEVYSQTPVINHELINRHNISAQISKARNILLDDLFHSRLMDKYEKGTSAEATIFRAMMVHTASDENLKRIKNEILSFIHESKGKKNCFSKIIDKLTMAPFGMRKGVLPIYITEQLMELDDMPIIYLGKKELSLDALLMSNIMNSPSEYSLYVEVETGEKLEYIEKMENLFSDYGTYCREIEKRNRLSKLICTIQSWYRSLPQTSMTFMEADYEGQPVKDIAAFRKLFVGVANPREILFERIPKIFDRENLIEAYECVKYIKEIIDSHVWNLKKKAEMIVCKELGFGDNEDFIQSARKWYGSLSDRAKNSIYSVDVQMILNCIKNITDNDKGSLIEKLAKECTGFFVEDWTDSTINGFSESFKKLVLEVEEKSAVQEDEKNAKIVFSTEEGAKECFYDFDPDNITTSGYFFQNALDELIDEYGDSIENSEKVGILMNLVKKLMG